MATVRNTITLNDRMSPVLNNLTQNLTATDHAMMMLERRVRSGFASPADLIAARAAVQSTTTAVNQLQNGLSQIPPVASNVGRSFSNWRNPLMEAAAAITVIKAAFYGLRDITEIPDKFVMTAARLDLMNDGLQTSIELQDEVFAAANRSRGSYTAMASSIAKIGILASDAFGSTAEIVAFTELMQKSFVVGGSSTMEQQSGMYQLTQALASGKLQGDEFRSIMETAPMLAQAIATYTGKSRGDLKKMSRDGTITADIIKGAMFAAGEDINKKFKTIPRTFASAFNEMGNKALVSFRKVFDRITTMLNSPGMIQFIDTFSIGMQLIATALVIVIDNISGLFKLMQPFTPILIAIGAAIAAFTVITWAMQAATLAAAAAQAIYNAVMMANPTALMIAGIVGLIAALGYLYVTNEETATGMTKAWDGFISFFERVGFGFKLVWFGVLTTVGIMKVGILAIIDALINSVIGMINGLLQTLNLIPGVSIPIMKWSEMGKTAAQEEINAATARGDILAEDARGIEERDAQRASNVTERVVNRNKWIDEVKMGIDKAKAPFESNIGKVGEVGKIKDAVDISDEDLKLLKDVAAKEFAVSYRQITPQMSVTFGDVRETVDVNNLLNVIATMTEEALASSLVTGGI